MAYCRKPLIIDGKTSHWNAVL